MFHLLTALNICSYNWKKICSVHLVSLRWIGLRIYTQNNYKVSVFLEVCNKILLALSKCSRIRAEISKTNLTFFPPRFLLLILNIEVTKVTLISELLRKDIINNFDELISFTIHNNYDYRRVAKRNDLQWSPGS